MRKPGGNVQMFGDLGAPQPQVADPGNRSLLEQGEADTFTCGHCSRVVMVPVRADPSEIGGLCKVCMNMICNHCLGAGCTPWEKQMETREAKDRALRSYGM